MSIADQSFDLDMDGRRVLTDAAFRISMSGIAKIACYSNGGERGTVYADDARIASGSAYGQRQSADVLKGIGSHVQHSEIFRSLALTPGT